MSMFGCVTPGLIPLLAALGLAGSVSAKLQERGA
jgi:hypothetical protein